MKRLKLLLVEYKTGFWNTGNAPIVILDDMHRMFYDTSLVDRRVEKFNLPAGEYFVMSGKFQKMASPVEYPLEPLPKPERNFEDPEHFRINYINNPHTATIKWDERCINLDKSLRSLSFPEIVYILYHEYGHRFYNKNERACDIYASNRMLREGYNPSQIGNAIINTLSDNNMERKEAMINTLIK